MNTLPRENWSKTPELLLGFKPGNLEYQVVTIANTPYRSPTGIHALRELFCSTGFFSHKVWDSHIMSQTNDSQALNLVLLIRGFLLTSTKKYKKHIPLNVQL